MTDNQKNINESGAIYPELLSVAPSPHAKNPDTTQSVMLRVLVALLPACLWGVYSFGLRAAEILLLTTATAVLFEWLFQKIMHRKNTVSDLSAAVTGLLVGMNVPATAPLWLGIVGSFFAIVVVKGLFGGLGKNIVNPALAARVFMFAWPAEMGLFSKAGERINDLSMSVEGVDAIAGATPLASLKAGALPEDVTIFDMILGNTGGVIGEVSAVLLILGGIYLLMTKVITWQIPVTFIATVALVTFLFPTGPVNSVDFMLSHVFSGGLMLGAIFMATDYVTSPVTPVGQLIFGAGCGLLTVFIRYFGGYPEGVSFAILIMNLLVGYIDKVTMPRPYGGSSNARK